MGSEGGSKGFAFVRFCFQFSPQQQHLSAPVPESGPAEAWSPQGQVIPHPQSLKVGGGIGVLKVYIFVKLSGASLGHALSREPSCLALMEGLKALP